MRRPAPISLANWASLKNGVVSGLPFAACEGLSFLSDSHSNQSPSSDNLPVCAHGG
jgi:hypothetical protein